MNVNVGLKVDHFSATYSPIKDNNLSLGSLLAKSAIAHSWHKWITNEARCR